MVKHMDQPLLQTSVDNDEKDAPQSSSTEWPQPHTNSGSWDTSGDAPQSSSKEWLNAWPQTYAKNRIGRSQTVGTIIHNGNISNGLMGGRSHSGTLGK